ncbi:MAG: HAD family hydrolase [Acidaminococcaceae bacterium]|jgi:phosphoglycolate phosphatase|nr:HAD family hydrolase [Acidaminococcaceae bacterium]
MNYQAVIFDLDGTLVNSLDDLADSANAMLAQLGYPTHPVEKYKYFVGNGSRKLIERILPADKRSKEEVDACLKLYQSIYDLGNINKTRLYPGITEMVAHLKKQGLKLGVCTNKHVSAATLILDHFFSKDTFPDFVADRPGTDFKRKPDPTEVLKLAARLGVQPEQVAYLGDTSVDMETATRAGFLPVGVLWGFRTKQELLQSGARILLSQPAELLEKVTFAK